MMHPIYKNLHKTTCGENALVRIATGSAEPQGNPRLYKYFWRVFSAQSTLEGDDFLMHAPALCSADYGKEVERLVALNLPCLIYGFRRPRNDPSNPWDLSNPKWADRQFAVSWDEDTDPIVMGGHK
jgi:hypothetical protein